MSWGEEVMALGLWVASVIPVSIAPSRAAACLPASAQN